VQHQQQQQQGGSGKAGQLLGYEDDCKIASSDDMGLT
jgi:hypothetical protein